MKAMFRHKPLFLSHGQPTLIIDKHDPARKYLIDLGEELKKNPKPSAIVIVSAHWEQKLIEVTSSTNLIYDFYGFPKEMYEYKYKAPESPTVANRVLELLQKSGVESKMNSNRGIDHGTWVPLSLMFPDEDIPIVQVSMNQNLDMKYHIDVGKALRPLLDENILFISSGNSVHSFQAIRESKNGKTDKWIYDFEDWLQTTLGKEEEERNNDLINWENAPNGRRSHPREDHFIPLGVVAGITSAKAKRIGLYCTDRKSVV